MGLESPNFQLRGRNLSHFRTCFSRNLARSGENDLNYIGRNTWQIISSVTEQSYAVYILLFICFGINHKPTCCPLAQKLRNFSLVTVGLSGLEASISSPCSTCRNQSVSLSPVQNLSRCFLNLNLKK